MQTHLSSVFACLPQNYSRKDFHQGLSFAWLYCAHGMEWVEDGELTPRPPFTTVLNYWACGLPEFVNN